MLRVMQTTFARGLAVGLALVMLLFAQGASAAPPAVKPVPGRPMLFLGLFNLQSLGYSAEEFFVSGEATSYKPVQPLKIDGAWKLAPADKAAYATRIVVAKPSDPSKFNGTVVVEWLNVTGGSDIGPDWVMTHRELIRNGYAWVGVSAQKVGIEGGQAMIEGVQPLKKANPQRYGELSHPGDQYSYDMFSQVGQAVRAPGASGLLGALVPKKVLAMGESQSAGFLTSYVNGVDPLAKVYDGYLIHSRFGFGSRFDGAPALNERPQDRIIARMRPDLRVPVILFITETDLTDGRLPGYHRARQPDNAKLRVWEIPGSAHADNYTLQVGFMDSGVAPIDKLAGAWKPITNMMGKKLPTPINFGQQHHYAVQASLAHLNAWVTSGKAPPSGQPIATEKQADGSAKIIRDANGLATGGVRTPWMDVPTARLTGESTTNEMPAALFGTGDPFDAAKLQQLYPGGKAEYLKKFEASLDSAISKGFLLAADRQEILDLAAALYPAQ